MIDSLSTSQINRVRELGEWRDEGHRFAVGVDGEVFTHTDDEVEIENATGQRGQGPSRPPESPAASAAPAPPAPSDTQSAGAHRSEAVRARYRRQLLEVKVYYPTLRWCDADQGLWAVVRSFPLGRDGPAFWICMFLPDDPNFDPKLFAFERISPTPVPVGPRHTNYPDASVCSHIPENDAWRPGDNPLRLLNLCAEWLVCQLFLKVEKRWPGKQFGMDEIYRHAEFQPEEWCCDSGLRYGECHATADAEFVRELKRTGRYRDHGPRVVPHKVLAFAKSKWKRKPGAGDLELFPYRGLPPRY